MLVQKGAISKRTKILIAILIGILLIGGGYFGYQSYISRPTTVQESLVKDKTEVDIQSRVSTFDDEIFNDPQLFSLERQKFSGFTDQHKGITLNSNDPLSPQNIAVNNPKTGQKMVINWQIPDYINFDNIRIYRSEVAGQLGEIIFEKIVRPEDKQKMMNYQDQGLVNNKVYYYLVRSVSIVDQEGKERESDSHINISQLQKEGRPTDEQPPAPPSNVQVLGLADGEMKISWLNPDDSDFERIKIYRSSEKGQLGSLIDGSKYDQIGYKDMGRDFRYYIDSDIQSNIVYYYTVTSVDTSGNESSKDIVAAPYKSYFYNPFEPIEF